MKVRLLCEIEADVIDEEELESIKDTLDKGRSMKYVERLWKEVIEKSLKNVCSYPVYDNKKLNIKVEYADTKHEIQEFQLGDTAYMIDEDYRFYESEVCRVELRDGKYYYDTHDCDFSNEDIGDWVFKSEMYRELHLEAMS